MCGVTNPPVTLQPLTSARPTDDSQQETGEAGRAKAKGCKGRGGCGSVDQVSLSARGDARCKRRQKEESKTHPQSTREPRGNHQENAARGTPPTQNREESATRPRKATETSGNPTKTRTRDEKTTHQDHQHRQDKKRENTEPETSDDDEKKKKQVRGDAWV